MNTDDLHSYLFAGAPEAFSEQMAGYLRDSRRFADFIRAANSKVRKKLRAAKTPESVADLGLELETAYLLLRERALSVVYEPQLSGQPRRPDFAVTFTTHSTLMLEVTHLQGQQTPAAALVTPERLAETVCGKLGQCSAQRSNVLLIGTPLPTPTPEVVQTALEQLVRRAERHDATLLKRSLLRDWGTFFQHYQRLSEVLVCGLPRHPGIPPTVWLNPQAKRPLTRKVRAALYRSQSA